MRIRILLDPSHKDIGPLLATLDDPNLTLNEATEGLKLLSELHVDDGDIKAYKEHAATKFPLAKAFKVTGNR